MGRKPQPGSIKPEAESTPRRARGWSDWDPTPAFWPYFQPLSLAAHATAAPAYEKYIKLTYPRIILHYVYNQKEIYQMIDLNFSDFTDEGGCSYPPISHLCKSKDARRWQRCEEHEHCWWRASFPFAKQFGETTEALTFPNNQQLNIHPIETYTCSRTLIQECSWLQYSELPQTGNSPHTHQQQDVLWESHTMEYYYTTMEMRGMRELQLYPTTWSISPIKVSRKKPHRM